MVLYHNDGRADKVHEEYLEGAAQELAQKYGYENQSDALQVSQPDIGFESEERVKFKTLYTGKDKWLDAYQVKQYLEPDEEERCPENGVHKTTLMRCSGYAQQYFAFHPHKKSLPLPISNPRRHALGTNEYDQFDLEMAHITRETIEEWIVPWLRGMEAFLDPDAESRGKIIPSLNINGNTPLNNISLYGVALQLGLPKFIQKPLVQVLCEQLYEERLEACHLEALEISVARFYSRGVPILDPVLNHFIGTYALREIKDRQQPGVPQDTNNDPSTNCRAPGFITYVTTPAERGGFEWDTYIVPPRLPILGHCIRHWSGIRRNGDTAAAHVGYPLNVGYSHKRFNQPTTKDYYGESTYLLRDVQSLPGQKPLRRYSST